MKGITTDENLKISGSITEDDVYSDILLQKLELINEDLSNYEPEIQLPSNKQMNAAISVLRRSVQCRGNNTEFQLNYDYEGLINKVIIGNCQ